MCLRISTSHKILETFTVPELFIYLGFQFVCCLPGPCAWSCQLWGDMVAAPPPKAACPSSCKSFPHPCPTAKPPGEIESAALHPQQRQDVQTARPQGFMSADP